MAHPCAQHVISLAAVEDGAAAGVRETQKSLKYDNELDVWDRPSNCIALVFAHFGCWGQDVMKFLHQLSLQSVDEDGKKKSRKIKSYWRSYLSVALQRCNASV